MTSFTGAFTALITPFRNGAFDEKAYCNLIDWQIASGIDGLVPLGTTGESPCVSYEEHFKIISACVKHVRGRVPVVAGAGSNATNLAIKLAKQAKEAGADATLQVTPYYNKPTQEGLFQHFKAVAEAVDLPHILYNVPGRTSVNMLAETTIRLSKVKNIVGVKEACGDLTQIQKVIEGSSHHFIVLSGDDALNTQVYAAGGKGTISVASNVAPAQVARIWDLYRDGDSKVALAEQEKLEPLNHVLFIETNPIPAKTALALMGKCALEFRLPLVPMSEQNLVILKKTLQQFGLL